MRQETARLRRPVLARKQRAIIVVVCEGATEYAFLDEWRRTVSGRELELKLYQTKKTTPVHLVRTAMQKRDEALRRSRLETGDAVWVACDGDEHRASATQRMQWREAMQQARAEGIEIAWSNPSFELWLLLHFQDQTSQLDATAATKALRKHEPAYEKGDNSVTRRLGAADADSKTPRLQDALRRAGEPVDLPEHAPENPATRFGVLMRQLLRFG